MPIQQPARRPATKPADQVALAACSIALTAGNELQLLPAGEFRGVDGRPLDAPHWYVDAALAQVLIAAADARKTPYVIDYEHQTLLARQNGQPAPAAGWFKKLEWRAGVGLFAIDVKWTPRATTMIEGSEYKFISPVILYNKASGNVTALLMAAATNNPNIDGMEQLLLDAAALHFSLPLSPTSLSQENQMDELLEQLRWMLNMPVGTTAEEILAQLQKLADILKQDKTVSAAASFDLAQLITSQRTTIASLSSATPDPAKYVSIDVMQSLQTTVAQLTADLNTSRLDGLVKDALDAGKLLPSQEAWAREWGGKDFAALSAYIENAPSLALLSGTQTGGKPPRETPQPGALTENQVALCAAMGVSQEDFIKTQQAELQA